MKNDDSRDEGYRSRAVRLIEDDRMSYLLDCGCRFTI